jgi:lariat debranching enzyme
VLIQYLLFCIRRYHGGWLAPNIYYLGAAGSVIVNGIRIAGASGIFKRYDYRTGEEFGRA